MEYYGKVKIRELLLFINFKFVVVFGEVEKGWEMYRSFLVSLTLIVIGFNFLGFV